jgi:flagellar motor component MotA
MQDNLALFIGLFFAFIFLVVGAMLLNDALSNVDSSQSAHVIIGAASISLGAATLCGALKNWWRWRKEFQRYRTARRSKGTFA